MNTIVLDAGALIAVERRNRRMLNVLERAAIHDWTIVVPAAVIAETWRGATTHPAIARLLKAVHRIAALDQHAAKRIGSLLAATGLSAGAHVVDAALESAPCVIATSDPTDLQRIIAATHPAKRIELYPL